MHSRRLTVLTLVIIAFCSTTALADNQHRTTQVVAPVKALLGAMQSGDVKTMRAQYAPSITIVDDHPPFLWWGKNAEDAYALSFDPFAKKVKMTGLKVWLGEPEHIHIATTNAYAVVRVRATSTVDGKPFHERGLLAFTLQKMSSGWKITTQTYTEDTQAGRGDPYQSR